MDWSREDNPLNPGDLVEEGGLVGTVIGIDPTRDWFKVTVFWSAPRRGRRIDQHPWDMFEVVQRCGQGR